jgi:hypothetical protein
LDPKYYRALLEQAKAAVAMAKSQLKAAVEQVSYTSETVSGQIAQAEAACQTASLAIQATHHIRDRAKAVLDYKGEALAVAEAGHQERQALEEKARIDYDRMSRLLEKKAISGLESDIAKLGAGSGFCRPEGKRKRLCLFPDSPGCQGCRSEGGRSRGQAYRNARKGAQCGDQGGGAGPGNRSPGRGLFQFEGCRAPA